MVLLPFPLSANLEGELSKTNPVLKIFRSRVAAVCLMLVAMLQPFEAYSATCSAATALTCLDSTPCKDFNGTLVCLSTVPTNQMPPGALQTSKSCWTAQGAYTCTNTSTTADNCAIYKNDNKCGITSSTCIETDPSNPAKCLAYNDTYQCQTGGGVQYSETDCSGETFCTNGVCYTKKDQPNGSLGRVIGAMEVSRMSGFYADSSDPTAPSIFKGAIQWCSENSIGLANCCKPEMKGMTYTNALITEELIKSGWNTWIREVVGSSYTFDTLFDSAMGYIEKAIDGMTEVLNGTSVATGEAVTGAASNASTGAAGAANPPTQTATGPSGGTQPTGAATGGMIGGAIGQQAGSQLAANNGANTIWTGVAGAGGYAAGTVLGSYAGAYVSAVGTTLAGGGSIGAAGSAGSSAMGAVSICWVCIIVMVILMIIMALLACDMPEIKTQMKLGAGLCHEAGPKYCVQKNEMNRCLTYRHQYCCFNSKLARIIHEQGRPQIGLSWGSAQSPNCRGLTVAELEAIDFSKMDLSEFIADVVAKAAPNPEEIAARVNDRVNEFFNTGAAGSTRGILPEPIAGVPIPIDITQPGPSNPIPMPPCDIAVTKLPPNQNGDVEGTFTVTNCHPTGTAVWNYVGTCPAIPAGSIDQATGASSNMPITTIDAQGSTTFTYTVPAVCMGAATPAYFNSWRVMVSDPNDGLIGSVNANW